MYFTCTSLQQGWNNGSLTTFCQDIPTQIFHWDFFKHTCKSKGVKPGKYLRPGVAEFLSGLHYHVRIIQWVKYFFLRFLVRIAFKLDAACLRFCGGERLLEVFPASGWQGRLAILKLMYVARLFFLADPVSGCRIFEVEGNQPVQWHCCPRTWTFRAHSSGVWNQQDFVWTGTRWNWYQKLWWTSHNFLGPSQCTPSPLAAQNRCCNHEDSFEGNFVHGLKKHWLFHVMEIELEVIMP